MKASFIVFSLILVLARCSDRQDIGQKPEKINGIPTQAFWVGGQDGGTWFVIDSVDSKTRRIVARVYNDQTGDLIANKEYNLTCSSVIINWTDLKQQIKGYDGNKILLTANSKDKINCYFE